MRYGKSNSKSTSNSNSNSMFRDSKTEYTDCQVYFSGSFVNRDISFFSIAAHVYRESRVIKFELDFEWHCAASGLFFFLEEFS